MAEDRKLTDAQVTSAQAAFSTFDKRNEGHIKVGDIAEAMKKLGHQLKASFLEDIEDTIDTDGTGYIGLEQFTVIFKKKLQADEDERELREYFRVLDKEKRGEVNTNELRWILKGMDENMGEDEIDELIAGVDTDSSGWIDFEEFSKLMTS